MASIRDAIEESVIEGGLAYTKYFIMGGLFYTCADMFLKNKGHLSGLFWIVAIATFILVLGFSLIVTQNVKNNSNKVLPSFNIFALLWQGLKGFVAIGPIVLVNMFLAKLTANFIVKFFMNVGLVSKGVIIAIDICVCAVFLSFMLTAYLLYANRFKVIDAYNIKLITKYCIDIIFAIFFFIPKLAFADLIIVGGVTYIFWLLFGIPNPICTYFWCVAFAWNLAVSAGYLAQVNYETIDYQENQSKENSY